MYYPARATPLRVLVSSATPLANNVNPDSLCDIVEGFEACLGAEQVRMTPIDFAPQRVADYSPDVVIVVGSCLADWCDFARLRAACDTSGSILAFWLLEDPFEFDAHVKVLDVADHIFTNDRWAAEHYVHPHVSHLPPAASPRRHAPHPHMGESIPQHDVFYYGAGYANRRQLLHDLQPALAGTNTAVRGWQWDTGTLPFCQNLKIDADLLPHWYARARVVLNLPRDCHLANRHHLVASTPGAETFAAALAGACQLLFVHSLEVLDYFEHGKEILLFNNPNDFQRQLRMLLDDPMQATAIGAAARKRCLGDHTFAVRARQMLECLGWQRPAALSAEGRVMPNHQPPHLKMHPAIQHAPA